MAEALVSAILQQLTTMTAERAQQELGLVRGVGEEVRKLTRNLEAIRAVLADAEQKQMMEGQESVKHWLNRLKEASYEIEDLLDEWKALASMTEDGVQNTSSSTSTAKAKVSSFISSFRSGGQVFRRRSIALKIKEINTNLDQIAQEKDRYGLVPREVTRSRRPERETTSAIDTSKLHGRDEVKKTIIGNLLSRDSCDEVDSLRTITITGMGGIGKTALAQLVYHDRQVKEAFHHRIWVCVSDFFDPIAIARAIIIELEGLNRNAVFLLDSVPLESLLNRIQSSLDGKRFFLVLDDVWTEDGQRWESLIQTFKCGASGSRILVTTRKETVARTMESSHIFPLEKLSRAKCWYVLRQLAFIGREEEECERLEDIGKQIADKCKGLPLAAKTLGSLLRYKRTRAEWEDVMNSEIWKLEKVHEGVSAPLLLSYYDLPPAIRRCFVYCVIYPKDYVYWRHHIIEHWMAQGYLGLDDDPRLELTGEEYLEFLADRSFFQDFGKDEKGVIHTWKIHDIVHDFAQSLAVNEILAEKIVHGKNSVRLTSESARHLRVMLAEEDCLPSSFHGVGKLRSFLTFSGEQAITSEALCSLFNLSKCLRLLDLAWPDSCNHLNKTIPKEIGKLKHLRYLNLARSKQITSLPESLCGLCNLQSLDLKGCSRLQALPHGMGRLINLRNINTVGCNALTYYPKGVGRLTSLRTLREITVRADCNDPKEFSMGDLENLDNLTLLWMKLVGNSIDAGEAKKAKLHNKIHLDDDEFVIRLCGNFREDDVFEALNQPSKLQFNTNYWWK